MRQKAEIIAKAECDFLFHTSHPTIVASDMVKSACPDISPR
jgi:hypothetical protein